MKRIIKTLAFISFFFVIFCLYQVSSGQDQQPVKTPPTLKNPRDYTAYLIGHAHIDLSWLWIWEETVHDRVPNTFLGTLAQMDRMPALTFAQSQAAIYEVIEKEYPVLFQMITKKIKEGTWIPVGGMWVESDLNLPDGEALARQFLYGKRYFLEKFGVDVRVGWNPDSFGQNWQLPQILQKSGIKYYVFGRCAPSPDPTHVFWWEGMDGSKVLAFVPPGEYNVDLKSGLSEIFLRAIKNTGLKDFMILYSEDYGGGPRNSDLEAIRKFKNDRTQPKMEFGVPEDYFKNIEASAVQIPTVKKELNFAFPACYTTQAETKKNNRKSENLLLTAEKFSALAATSGYRDFYPERDLDEAWKIVLRNQFHDILAGSSIGPVHDEVREFYREVFRRGNRALDFSLETITSMIDTRGEGLPLIVYNQLFWERTEPAVGEISLVQNSSSASIKIFDSAGLEIPVQVIEKQLEESKNFYRFIFIAENVPSMGYKVYRVVNSDAVPEFKTSLAVTADKLENEYFKVILNPLTGWIKSIYDKTNGKEVLAGEGNVLQAIVDEPKEDMSAWELGLKDTYWNIGEAGAKIEVIERGPVRVVIRIKNIFRNSEFEQDVMLYHKVPRVDCQMRLNWQERKLMIKAAFPVNVKNETAEFEIPFGSIIRPTDGAEVPSLKWIDVSDSSGDYGVSLLNDCKYGFDVKGGTMRISIIRGATSPDPEADRGCHELLYSLYPHRGTGKEANTIRRGYELNNQLLAKVGMVHAGPLPAVHSFFQVEPENVIVTALKKEMGYYSRGVILRLYESQGKKTEVKVKFPWKVEVYETNLIEQPSKKTGEASQQVLLTVEPYEIKTVKVFRKVG